MLTPANGVTITGTFPMNRHDSECTIIIFGAAGDLSKRKLFPAIARLIHDQHLTKWSVIGVDHRATTPQKILDASRSFTDTQLADAWSKLVESFVYLQLDFENPESFSELKTLITQQEKDLSMSGNRLFFLATMPEHFVSITRALANHKIVLHANEANTQCGHTACPWERVIYEKPFGQDSESAKAINEEIAQAFSEKQVFRIDHYLGKELVANIATIRFANLFLQPLWSKDYIDTIQITLKETLGVEERGAFYDNYGALKDVVQNHMLQLAALVGMERPKELQGDAIRNAKVDVLNAMNIDSGILGQYNGYRSELNVHPNSNRETFALLKLSINNERWKGVPIILKTGKALDEKSTRIHITFKKPPPLAGVTNESSPNRLTLNIEPDEGFFLTLNGKMPGATYTTTPVTLSFCHKNNFGPNTPGAYEVLLHDAITSDQSTFVRFDEIERSWKIIDTFLENQPPLHTYDRGSAGPREIDLWAEKEAVKLID
jgi:glucose-6-phosphate 1-dehydrogenase